MSHGKIHQHHKTDGRTNNALLHFLQGILRWGLFFLFSGLFLAGNHSIVAGILNRLNDGCGDLRGFRFHLHGTCQQIHIRLFHTGNRIGNLLHPGRTGGAGHSGNVEFQFHGYSPFFCYYR